MLGRWRSAALRIQLQGQVAVPGVAADYNPNVTFASSNILKYNTTGSAAGVTAGNIPVLFSPALNFAAGDVAQNITAAINNPITPPLGAFPGLVASWSGAAMGRREAWA